MPDDGMQLVNMTTGTGEQQRTPTIFKTSVGGGGATIWTPASGKKFRMLGFNITVTNDYASATAENNLALLDNATTFMRFSFFCPATGITTVAGKVELANMPILPGNGYLSIAADNPLKTFLSGALTAGQISMNVWGCEE